ncbi:LuxR family transcriptional regulator [Streptomyces sp. GESEQ-35]|uniref:helix-turn-helix transcriptional regulator n=1 Tax=Streptomyces sp. GESEQ-35 TaxID=2812657 RepID=UPI001B323F43|nr:LuxR family transcriptional regulator [Streptomyces sp. GESEQ-35]
MADGSVRGRPTGLTGRRDECEVLDGLVNAVRAGGSRVLVVRGDPGVGKTALLEYMAGQASGCWVARAVGVQSEMELAFAGLHQLVAPMLDRLERLPVPQRDALRVAFGLSVGPAPDRFFIGLAVLGLLADVAEEQPLVCLVDDEQWLDHASAQVLAFVARRLEAESVGLVFAVRAPSDRLAGLSELVVKGLREDDAWALLDTVLTAPLDAGVRDQIVAETRGNPLALLELLRELTPAELAGGFGLPGGGPLSGSIEETFARRLAALPAQTRRLVQLAAADPVGDPVLVRRAAGRLGIQAAAATPAAEADLLEFHARVRFRHPLVRSAAYRSATLQERQEVHRALAEATDPVSDPDRRAWHRAHAASGPDEDVAAELERSAGRARVRGGLAAAAAFLERSAELTGEPGRRSQRLLAAAQAKHDAGAIDAALGLLVSVEAGPLDAQLTAQLQHLRGQIAFDQRRAGDAARLLLSAARRLEPVDAGAAREAHLAALGAAIWVGDQDRPGGLREAAAAACAAPRAGEPPRTVDLLLDAFAVRCTKGYTAAAPLLTRALESFAALRLTDDVARWLWSAVPATDIMALELWNAESWHALATRQVRFARDAGALVHLPLALNCLAWSNLLAGELTAAAALLDEDRLIAEVTRNPPVAYMEMMLAAWRGQDVRASALIEAAVHQATAGGLGWVVTFANYAASVLHNGLGRYDAARDAAWRAFEGDEVGYGPLVVPELAEAAARTGDVALVKAALEWLSERTRVTPNDWSLGIEARIRALLTEGDAAESLYRESIARLGRTRARVELARTHLLYGEWLRREPRRADARTELRTAHEMLTTMGVEAFAERARRELVATGETVRKRTQQTRDVLTAQEAQVAWLARDGLSNPEIGTRLFISPRTVQYHLSKVFAKLGISSRNELDRVLPSAPDTDSPR